MERGGNHRSRSMPRSYPYADIDTAQDECIRIAILFSIFINAVVVYGTDNGDLIINFSLDFAGVRVADARIFFSRLLRRRGRGFVLDFFSWMR